ncbi:MAG: endopeptidase La [bacterium]
MFDQSKLSQMELFEFPSELPMLIVRDVVVFPYTIVPLFVGRRKSIQVVESALTQNGIIFLTAQKSPEVDDPKVGDFYEVGTVSVIMRHIKLPDGSAKILVQGMMRARALNIRKDDFYYRAEVEKLTETVSPESGDINDIFIKNMRSQLRKCVSLGKNIMPDVIDVANNINESGRIADLVVSNFGFDPTSSQEVLEALDPVVRLKLVNNLVAKEIELLQVQQKIQNRAKKEIDSKQREYYLRQQLKAIQSELGQEEEYDGEIEELREKIISAQLPEDVGKEAEKQLSRLERMGGESAEAAIIRNYLDSIISLPWNSFSKDKLDIKGASKILDEDHYGLHKVKRRILESLAVRKLNPGMKSPILCLVGPPGVGKTSLGRSVARAMGRKFVQLSMGGVRDEAEIRGHRRTYVGSLPGRIINGLKQAGTNNPVFMIDEVDKIGSDLRGSPADALLEVLDPEQNDKFVDRFLEVPFDLSRVFFITTANQIDPIQPAFRDRMEVISLSGYNEREKLLIAKRYLVPRQLKENGINSKLLDFSDNALLKIIFEYTMEAGLRNLEREIGAVCRQVAREVAEGKKRKYMVTSKNLRKYLGAQKLHRTTMNAKITIGVSTGLAWTEAGGDILFVEASKMKGSGKLIITGHLGEVMTESAQAALSYIHSNAEVLEIKESVFEKNDIHIHVPAGAIPKDGPSAGVAIASAITSRLKGVPIKNDLAMTGEITLSGRVLPVGGINEKVLAAMRAGIFNVMLPEDNRNDIEELPRYVRKKVNFKFVSLAGEALSFALVKTKEKE